MGLVPFHPEAPCSTLNRDGGQATSPMILSSPMGEWTLVATELRFHAFETSFQSLLKILKIILQSLMISQKLLNKSFPNTWGK